MRHRTEYPRLHTDEPDPPAPLPFRADAGAAPGRVDDTGDAARRAEHALDRAQRALDELAMLADELGAETFPFPHHDPDDDAPTAA